ncbi:expressed unknown protein [Seminavis robusta]|uniref:Uncharacterized protein n=1 Tax=Seminavis robusta TaxID=568900 RepID=A0A9N8D8T3_9STRA|nr:expressed unknown protein [Seminavis robusta]|eukprot:Sro18_g012760.1 n/a (204) ;mRNA; r:58202-58813
MTASASIFIGALLIALPFATGSAANAHNIRGSDGISPGFPFPASESGTHGLLNPKEIFQEGMEDGRCKSLGFLYHGGKCASVSDDVCQDFQHDVDVVTTSTKVLLVVANSDDPSLVYYEKLHQPGSLFQITAIDGNADLPGTFIVSVFESSHDPRVGVAVSRGRMVQTMVLNADCRSDLTETPTRPVQLVFTARSPLKKNAAS